MQLNHFSPSDHEFISDVYGGRPIAILHRHGRWHVYLDHVLQQVVFATSEDATAWLFARVDEAVPARLH
jgi:hypothetical protein